MRIATDAVVSIHYQVATAEGEHVDASQPGQPLLYLHGHGNLIPGLEKQLVGKERGAKFTAEIPAAEAYGAHDPELDFAVPITVFPEAHRTKMQPGFQFQAEHPTKTGVNVLFTVHGVEGDQVLVSGNHQLAGKDLIFQIDIADVRAASREELAHGHVHGPGGHHHH